MPPNSWIAPISAVCLLTISSACVPSRGLERAALPELPADLAAPCVKPALAAEDARLALAKNRAALTGCAERHDDTVAFYRDLREGPQ